MDPNANLEEQCRLAARILAGKGVHAGDIERLAELVEALDRWICNGGFLPTPWQRGQNGGKRTEP